MPLNNKTITILGTGKMGVALIRGLASSIGNPRIIGTDILPERRKVAKEYGAVVMEDNHSAMRDADIVVIAVKPHHVKELCREIYDFVTPRQLIISIAAGVRLDFLRKNLPTNRIVRVMPNVAAMVREAMTAIASDGVPKDDLETVRAVFGSVGECIVVDESLMDLMTALIGSGPGFVAAVANAFVEAGRSMGLDAETSTKIANKILLGSAIFMLKTNTSPSALKGMVATPGGTTMAGLSEMEKADLERIISEVIEAATNRATEISKEISA